MLNFGNVFILGDSYSTFENFVPENYDVYYTNAGREETDVISVNQTWWHQLICDTNSKLLQNCSYSGTTICNTGYDKEDCSDISFIGRMDKLVDNNYFKENKVDTIFIFGGTNDSWADSPVGELMYTGWNKENLYSVLPAFSYLLHRISQNAPYTNVICILNTDLKPVIVKGMKAVCKKYNVDIIELNNIDKKCEHPTVLGMKQIKEQIVKYIQLVKTL